MIESLPKIKRNVYSKSNKSFNKRLNIAFSIQGVEQQRPIDVVLELAKKAGMTKTDLATKLGTSPQGLNNWIDRGMPARYNHEAAKLFGVPVERILGLEDRLGDEPRLEQWILDYYGLDEDQRQQIREIAEDRMARFKNQAQAPSKKRKR